MLLPIELFHVCVRIHIDISDIRRDRPEQTSRDVPDARVVPRRVPAPRARAPGQPRASAARRRVRVWLWRYWVCASRGRLRPTSLAAGGYIGYLRPPYSYAIVTLTGFISPFVGPAYSYLHTSLLTLGWP